MDCEPKGPLRLFKILTFTDEKTAPIHELKKKIQIKATLRFCLLSQIEIVNVKEDVGRETY